MAKTDRFRLGFDGLVDFAQRNTETELLDRFGQPAVEVIDRNPWLVPDWLRNDSATVITVGTGVEVVLEGGTDEGQRSRIPPEVTPDVLAYYLPYHIYDRDTWGIYLRGSGIQLLANGLKTRSRGRSHNSRIRASFDVLLQHEYFHCVAETAATKVELITAVPIYKQYFRDWQAREHEEALGNAQAYRLAARRYPASKLTLHRWMSRQPPGYKEFKKWIGRDKFDHGRSQAAQYVLRHAPIGILSRPPIGGEFLLDPLPLRRIPCRVVLESGSLLGVVKPFPKFEGMRLEVHTNDHLPRHFHLERPPGSERGRFEWPSLVPLTGTPRMSGGERARLNRYLERFGAAIARKVATVYGP